MNDRFKFKCWNTIVKGFVPIIMNGDGDFSIDQNAFEWEYGDDWDYVWEKENNTLEQCTGLKDKNGKLIYDGDIIKSPSNSNVLRVYQEDSGLWRCVEYRVGGRKELPLYQLCDYGVEICGNIHENEELYNG